MPMLVSAIQKSLAGEGVGVLEGGHEGVVSNRMVRKDSLKGPQQL